MGGWRRGIVAVALLLGACQGPAPRAVRPSSQGLSRLEGDAAASQAPKATPTRPSRSPTWRSAPSREERDPLAQPERLQARLTEAGIRRRLDALRPAYRQRLVAEAGGEQALVTFLRTIGTKLAFQRLVPDHGEDIFVYDRTDRTVLELPGVNTGAHELVPAPTIFDRYLVYNSNEEGTWDVCRYDRRTRQVDALPDARGEGDELFPTVTLSGRWVACAVRTAAGPRLQLHDYETGNWLVPAVEAIAGAECRTPFISALGGRVVFATPVDGQLDLRVYDVLLHRDITPPHLNSPGDEAFASFSLDGSQLVFSSTRRGEPGLYLADLDTGVVEALVLTNTPGARQYAYFIGLDELAVLSTRTGELGCHAYRLDTEAFDTLPFCGKQLPGGPPGLAASDLLGTRP